MCARPVGMGSATLGDAVGAVAARNEQFLLFDGVMGVNRVHSKRCSALALSDSPHESRAPRKVDELFTPHSLRLTQVSSRSHHPQVEV